MPREAGVDGHWFCQICASERNRLAERALLDWNPKLTRDLDPEIQATATKRITKLRRCWPAPSTPPK